MFTLTAARLTVWKPTLMIHSQNGGIGTKKNSPYYSLPPTPFLSRLAIVVWVTNNQYLKQVRKASLNDKLRFQLIQEPWLLTGFMIVKVLNFLFDFFLQPHHLEVSCFSLTP